MRSDAELLAASADDPAAFRALYERYAERMLAFHLRRCRSEDAAHDLTAETFAQAWLSRASFRDASGGTAGPWLFGIARNVLASSVLRGRIEDAAVTRLGMRERLDGDGASIEPDPSWLEDVDAALADLPDGQQEAIRLRVIDDLAYEDVAATLAITPDAARVRVHRGLRQLRTRITNPKEVTP